MFKETAFKNTLVGEIPEEWEAIKIGNLVTMKYGYRCSIPRTSVSEKGTKIVSTADITKDGDLVLSKIRRIEAPSGIVDEYQIDVGDLLFNWRNAQVHVGKTALIESKPNEKMIFASFLLRLRCNELIDKEYLHFLLNYLREKGLFYKLSRRAVNQANFNAEELKEVIIALPPLPEQKGISIVLTAIFLAIQNCDNIIAKCERLKRGLMGQLLTHGIGHTEYKQTPIGKIPSDWVPTKIGDIAKLQSGGTPRRDVKEYWTNGKIPWLKSGELNDGEVCQAEERINQQGLENSAAKIFPKGTLLMAMYGKGTVTKTGILGIEAATNQAVCAFIPKDSQFSPKFLQYYLIFKRNQLLGQLTNPSTDMGRTNIYSGMLASYLIPLPAKQEEQEKIADILQEVDTKLRLEQLEKAKLQNIKRGLMDLLLTGKVRIKVD